MYHPLIDTDLKAFIQAGWIQDCSLDLVNPASVNLTIGPTAMREVPKRKLWPFFGSTLKDVDLRQTDVDSPLMIRPGELVLCDVGQVLHLPPNYEAQVILRSSAGRAGWDHALSGYVDPGYHGRLTLELVNCRRWQPLPLFMGQQLVQLRIYRLEREPKFDYSKTGRYQGATRVEASKDFNI